MKVKYFKKSLLLEADLGYMPSFIWRSLHSAEEFLCKGPRWRVINGASILIWEDRWLPTSPGFYVPSPPIGLPIDATVRDLVDPDTE
ncbi:hypothetical protein LINGRAPRIM_LOCUS2304 [Linum grandiflorum]